MGTKSRVGQYGTIPEDLYLRKIETTQMFEDADQVETYQRHLLKDRRPDPYLFESDAPRVCSESRALLNLRYGGARCNIEPYLPDGSFLGFDHFSKDPRSIMYGPDFTKAKEHAYARGILTNFYPDNDDSTLEEGINPLQMRENIIHSIPQLKNRMKIFETSMDSRSTKAAAPHYDGYNKDMLKVDHQILDLNSAVYAPRSDFTTAFTNASHIGWLTDVDARFQVAKYGQIRPEKPFTEQWHHNRRLIQPDQMLGTSLEGIHLGRDIALAMINHVRNKKHQMETGRNTLFGEGLMNTNKGKKETADRINHLIVRSSSLPSNALFNSDLAPQALVPQVDIQAGAKSIANPQIVEIMQKATQMKRKKETSDLVHQLQDQVLHTAADQGLYAESAPSGVKNEFDPMSNREEAQHNQFREDSQQIWDYRSLKPQKGEVMAMADYEAYKSRSSSQDNQQRQTLHRTQSANNYDGDLQDPLLEGQTKDRYIRDMHKSNMRQYMIEERNDLDMNDR